MRAVGEVTGDPGVDLLGRLSSGKPGSVSVCSVPEGKSPAYPLVKSYRMGSGEAAA
jgi:hypothetical protein